jgi:signal transduction histidine kinase
MDNKPKKVLLIEDNPGDVRLIQEMLSEGRYGIFQMVNVSRLAAGLEVLANEPIDVVLLDLGLPDSEGIDTLTRTKKEAPHVPIVILTGQSNELLGMDAVREGAQDYLVKGEVNSNLLVRTLSYAIERKGAEALLLDYQEKLRSLASQVSLAEEQERHRIATEVHDNISQTLAFCSMKLSLLLKAAQNTAFVGPLQEINECIQETASVTRLLTFELSPPDLYDFGLKTAVAGLSERMSKKYQIPIFFEDDGKKKNVEKDIQVELFRMARELLVNAVKHARAESIHVKFSRDNKTIKVSVRDDGIGFDTRRLEGNRSGGFGLFSIRERLQYLGGHLEIESKKGEGSRFTIIAPLKTTKGSA